MPQERIVLRHCETIDSAPVGSQIKDGLSALRKVKGGMTPKAVVDEVKLSELRGRGGAGFPCGVKWEMAREFGEEEVFLICNADEGEPGTFKDRYILENDPHGLIEGVAIAAHALEARTTFIYLRGEYRRLLERLNTAISEIRETGLLGDLEILIRVGAGSYICGEESALMNSIEGSRGECRYKPPFPTSRGLWGKPTVINNVETLMNISPIILHGASWYKQFGTERSKGTKVFSVSGDVSCPGVYELLMGSSLSELTDLAGARDVNFVQVGGASGRVIAARDLDVSLCYEGVLGSGAVTFFDRSRDVIDIVCRDLAFLAEESCGKCAPCREGTEAMVEILGRMHKGEGHSEDISALEELSSAMRLSSLCGLGQSAPTPVLDTLASFRMEYENRINQSLLLKTIRGLGR